MKREGLRMILRYPLAYLGVHLDGMLRVLFDPGSVDYLKVFGSYPRAGRTLANIADHGLIPVVLGMLRSSPLVFWTQLALFALLAAYYLLALRGLFSRSCGGAWEKIALVSIMAYFIAISGGPHGYSRFRHPVMPFLCVLAACGFQALARRRQP
jgi:hypothetical protein